jgi:hypothetical protein
MTWLFIDMVSVLSIRLPPTPILTHNVLARIMRITIGDNSHPDDCSTCSREQLRSSLQVFTVSGTGRTVFRDRKRDGESSGSEFRKKA